MTLPAWFDGFWFRGDDQTPPADARTPHSPSIGHEFPQPWSADPNDPDAALLLRLRESDESAFRTLWDAYHGRLIEFAYRYVRSYDSAADIVQQIFFRLWRERTSLTPRTTLLSHLYGGVRFRALRDLKHERVERSYEASTIVAQANNPAVAWNVGDAATETDALWRIVNTALARMQPRVREIFVMHRQDGLPAVQIAAILGIKTQVVYNQLSRALKILADTLRELGAE